jgi:hypothetical protein
MPNNATGPVSTAHVALPNGRAEFDAFVARFPRPSRSALVISLGNVVCGNTYLLWCVSKGELRFIGIVLLVLIEGFLLSLIVLAQRAGVPPERRMERAYEHVTLPTKAISWIAFMVAMGGAYLFWAFQLEETTILLGFLTSLDPWRAFGMDVALGVTLLFALFGFLADQTHYRRVGPPLVSSVEIDANARRIVFAYGAIVIAIPLIGTLVAAIWVIKRLIGSRDTQLWNFVGGISVLAVFFITAHAVAGAAASGPLGLAAIYLWGKTLVEGLFLMLPVLAEQTKAVECQRARRVLLATSN